MRYLGPLTYTSHLAISEPGLNHGLNEAEGLEDDQGFPAGAPARQILHLQAAHRIDVFGVEW